MLIYKWGRSSVCIYEIITLVSPERMISPIPVANSAQKLEKRYALGKAFTNNHHTRRTPLTPSPAQPFPNERQ
jgi:hypothetical protein